MNKGSSTTGIRVLALFFAWGGVACLPVFRDGGTILGFSSLTLLYFLSCLFFCLLMLAISRPARKRAVYMGLYLFAATLVLIASFDAHTAPAAPSDPGSLNINVLKMVQMGFAQLTIYVAPGALAAVYAYLAYTGRSAKTVSVDGSN